MAKFELTVKVGPPRAFGLPDAGVAWMGPSGTSVHSASMHTQTETLVGNPTPPLYRSDDRILRADVVVGEVVMRFVDNVIHATTEGVEPEDVKEVLLTTVDRVLRHLSLETQTRYWFDYVLFENMDTGDAWGPPTELFAGTMSTYDLEDLAKKVQAVANRGAVTDDRLERALDYYEQALWIGEGPGDGFREGSMRLSLNAMSSVLLNLTKAVSVIVGDKSADRDHQSRYRKFGISRDFFEQDVQWLWKIRDTMDVAHPSPDQSLLEEAKGNVARGREIVAEVLAKYADHLRRQREGRSSDDP